MKIKVLIVDDDIDILAALNESCKKLGIEPTMEIDPNIALHQAEQNNFFDIIIADYCFSHSDITGLQILAKIKQKYIEANYVPFIPLLCTGCGTKGLFSKEHAEGIIFGFLEKPFEYTDIETELKKAIRFLEEKK